MVKELHIVFDAICQFDGQSLRRIEDDLKSVRAIRIMCLDPQRRLLLDRFPEFVSGGSHEGRVEQVCAILLKGGSQTLPRLQIIANRRFSGLLR